jgi:hypothetical protein
VDRVLFEFALADREIAFKGNRGKKGEGKNANRKAERKKKRNPKGKVRLF